MRLLFNTSSQSIIQHITSFSDNNLRSILLVHAWGAPIKSESLKAQTLNLSNAKYYWMFNLQPAWNSKRIQKQKEKCLHRPCLVFHHYLVWGSPHIIHISHYKRFLHFKTTRKSVDVQSRHLSTTPLMLHGYCTTSCCMWCILRHWFQQWNTKGLD